MIGMRAPSRKAGKDEAEKPFWISFSDLMTALMVLFLVAMTVALLAITDEISEAEREKMQRDQEIATLLERIAKSTKKFPGVVVRGRSIDFGQRAHFGTNSHQLTSAQADLLRAFVPKILEEVRNPLGEKWLKRIVVEGFADQRGTYIHNLNLSLQRSERVLCVLLAGPGAASQPLSVNDRMLIRKLFLVGGSSFNSLKTSLDESRRIELKLEFLDIDEKRAESRNAPLDEDSVCPLDG